MRNKTRKLCSFIAAVMLMQCTGYIVTPDNINADAVPVVTIGADLSQEQKDKIYNFFGVSETNITIIEVNNSQERKYLEGLISNDIIGTRTLSCSYILPTNEGGIVVKTANLNWVTDGMLANALLTSGVENCQVVATAPFEVSGTGALTGVMLAYETSSGETLDESKKELATQELVITGELTDEIALDNSTDETTDVGAGTSEVELSKYAIDMLNDMKVEALNGNLDEDTAKSIVEKHLKAYGVDLSDEMKQKLIDYIMSFSAEDYAKTFKTSIDNLTERIKSGFDINININIDVKADESLSKFQNFWEGFLTYLKYIFGTIDVSEVKDKLSGKNIFDNINTDVIDFDEKIPFLKDKTEEEPTEEPKEPEEPEGVVNNPDVIYNEDMNEEVTEDEVE